MFSCPCITELQYGHIPLQTSLGGGGFFFFREVFESSMHIDALLCEYYGQFAPSST